jgi:hypothetical protein
VRVDAGVSTIVTVANNPIICGAERAENKAAVGFRRGRVPVFAPNWIGLVNDLLENAWSHPAIA